MTPAGAQGDESARLLEQAGKSTMRVGAILFLVGAGMTAFISLAVTTESQTRDIGSSIFLVALALGALGWALEDARRAERLLDLTGLSAQELRTGLGDPAVLGAVLDFLANHEPDLIACAEALETEPAQLIHAAKVLNS